MSAFISCRLYNVIFHYNVLGWIIVEFSICYAKLFWFRAIQYTIEKENDAKELQFLDIKVINNGTGKYEFNIFRKNAITNVQVKPDSSHDPRILRGVFKGFVYRAVNICSEKYLNQEIDFLINIFVENGYNKDELQKMVEEVKLKQTQDQEANMNSNSDTKQTIVLPWIPGV